MSQEHTQPSATAIDSGNNKSASNHGEKQEALDKDSGKSHTPAVEPYHCSGLRLWIIMSTIFLSSLLSVLDIVSQHRSSHARRKLLPRTTRAATHSISVSIGRISLQRLSPASQISSTTSTMLAGTAPLVSSSSVHPRPGGASYTCSSRPKSSISPQWSS